ncbi:hypothetical protein RRG08_012223 [Elysia crispata]|uniref:DNA-directed primase/polymerase protein n=1 Tax=Elysia crispata TaxID=231223 RepID=A0AAE0Z696_9GAST|nr:hypothetical protein RRG08_012223 [Elysia crispata]
MEFPVAKFYGRNSFGNRSKKKNYGKLITGQLRVPKPFNPRILGPFMCWETFYRQKEAFDFADSTSEDLRVFAFESNTVGDLGSHGGQRRYLVTSLLQFWHYYSDLLPNQRHHYEVIREGHTCKLFFDLEFLTEFNPGRNGNKMVDILIKYVCLWLAECFGLDCDRSDVLDLDACTVSKFSRHLVFQLNGGVFQDCVVAGYFVRHIFAILVQYIRLKTRKPFHPSCPEQLKQQNVSHGPTQMSALNKVRVRRRLEEQIPCCETYTLKCMQHEDADKRKERMDKENKKFENSASLDSNLSFTSEIKEEYEKCAYLTNSHDSRANKKANFPGNSFELDMSGKYTSLDEVIKSFQDSSDEEECKFLTTNLEKKMINTTVSIEPNSNHTSLSDSSCDEEELSLLVERCEQDMAIGVSDTSQDVFSFDERDSDCSDKELLASMNKWEESASAGIDAQNDSLCSSFQEEDWDDKELSLLENDFEGESFCNLMKRKSSDSAFKCDNCHDGEQVTLAKTSEKHIQYSCDQNSKYSDNFSSGQSDSHFPMNLSSDDECLVSTIEPCVVTHPSCSNGAETNIEIEELSQIAEASSSTTRLIPQHAQSVEYSQESCDILTPGQGTEPNETLKASHSPHFSWPESSTSTNTVRSDVERICSHFSLEELKSLMVLDKNQRETTFCDLGVYTKNRNFRLYLSSKLKKNNPLKVALQNQHFPTKQSCKSEAFFDQDVFMASLVSFTDNQEDMKVLKFGRCVLHTESSSFQSSNRDSIDNKSTADPSKTGYLASPFPQLDTFINSLVSGDERKQGRVRQWRHSPAQNSITYYITGYRWCSNILREHRSNNIFYTVNLTDWTYTQGCYDIDCRYAQRKVEKIPQTVLCRKTKC